MVVRIPLFIALFVSFSSFAQSEFEKEKLRQLEIQRQAERQRLISSEIDSVALFIDREEYEAADTKILYVLKSVKSVPSDLTFYFGKNSYYLSKYKQSVDWLNKYIQLRGTSGKFSDEALDIKQKAEVALLKQHEVATKQATEILSSDYDIDCGPTGKVVCPVCSGSTVIVKKGYFGDTYKTCGYCKHAGTLSCEDYNKLMKGQLTPTAN